MSSILNSILSGELQVQKTPEVKPVKEDSIIDLLQNSEIEFNTCPTLESNLPDMDTGFGENNDLHYETKCKKPELKTPLYQENYLKEFQTEEEKAAARHALGLYNKGDVVAMSLLTAEDKVPSPQEMRDAPIKQLRKGDRLFAPVTTFNAVYDSTGITLDVRVKEIQSQIITQQKEILNITQASNGDTISSLGDVKLFLKGFNNGETLQKTLNDMNQEMLRFESTGQITL